MPREGLNQRPLQGPGWGGKGETRNGGSRSPKPAAPVWSQEWVRRDLRCVEGLQAQKSSVQFRERRLSMEGWGDSCLIWHRGGQGGQGSHLGGLGAGARGLPFGTWWGRGRGRAQPQGPPRRRRLRWWQWRRCPQRIPFSTPLLRVQGGRVFGESVLHGACGPGVGGPGGWPRGLQRRRDGEAGEAQRGAWRGEEGEILRPLETASKAAVVAGKPISGGGGVGRRRGRWRC